jgi:hypothetical protein
MDWMEGERALNMAQTYTVAAPTMKNTIASRRGKVPSLGNMLENAQKA